MTLEQMLARIEHHEGWPKYTNRPSDKGGPTKGGVTQATLSAHRGRPVTPEEVMALGRTEVHEIYRQRYIAPWEWVANEQLRWLLVDYAITSWHDDPAIALQRGVGAKVDGIIGPKTRMAVLAADQDLLYAYVWRHRMGKFFEVAYDPSVKEFLKTNDETQLHNLRGWMNRLAEFL